ncbi:MAG: ring-cleaving dioxygenase [Elusimicrobia bacterium]|nr:MAG: ring-cleaving dioxygenase [Elusimicrobiota bacterium]
MLTLNRLDHINMKVSDLEASKDFYGRLFGFKEKESGVWRGQRWSIIGVPDRLYLALYETEEANQGEGNIKHLGFHVSDYANAAKEIKAAGAAIHHGPIDYGASHSVYVYDPDGNEIEISEILGGGLH